MKYTDYIAKKTEAHNTRGLEPGELNPILFDYQKACTIYALRRGRAAIFADTGLGKTMMQLAWADRVAKEGRVLILAPLAVAEQTCEEGRKMGMDIHYCREDKGEQITITNYEMLENFDPSEFSGIVLDESSILKSYDGATRIQIIEAFKNTPYRLACTATPAPNDYTELGNHSEFLGIKTRTEMLAEYFVHDMDTTQEWRLKGHAEEAFWRWVASWGLMLKNPEDLGFDGSRHKLPPLEIKEIVIPCEHEDALKAGYLFAPEVVSLSDQRAVRKATMEKRIEAARKLAEGDAPCLVWGELNDECDAVEKSIDGFVQVKGADSLDAKKDRLLGFSHGKYHGLVTKPSIAGFGMNWQHCNKMIFLGASHSYEQTYQAIRRCYRFGQKKKVTVWVIRAENETAIIENFKRKEADAAKMGIEMAKYISGIVRQELMGSIKEWNDYNAKHSMKIPNWLEAE